MRWGRPETCVGQHGMPHTLLVRLGSSHTSLHTSSVRPPMRLRPRVLPRRKATVRPQGNLSASGSVTSSLRRFVTSCLTTSGCAMTSAGRCLTAECASRRESLDGRLGGGIAHAARSARRDRPRGPQSTLFSADRCLSVAARPDWPAWLRGYRDEGPSGLADRSHKVRQHPWQIPADVESAVCELRRARPKWGPKRLVFEMDRRGHDTVTRSTVYRVLVRNGLIEPKSRQPGRPAPAERSPTRHQRASAITLADKRAAARVAARLHHGRQAEDPGRHDPRLEDRHGHCQRPQLPARYRRRKCRHGPANYQQRDLPVQGLRHQNPIRP